MLVCCRHKKNCKNRTALLFLVSMLQKLTQIWRESTILALKMCFSSRGYIISNLK
jgi:uncharacterized membrane protein (UPF0127 family)